MTTDNWINLVAAILVGGGTFALAFMTWKSIRQTRSIQKAEKRERLLNEIIEWAVEVSGEELELNPMITRAKGQHISKICLASWSDLKKDIGDVIKSLDKYIEILETTNFTQKGSANDIRESAIKVIHEAAKIKIGDSV